MAPYFLAPIAAPLRIKKSCFQEVSKGNIDLKWMERASWGIKREHWSEMDGKGFMEVFGTFFAELEKRLNKIAFWFQDFFRTMEFWVKRIALIVYWYPFTYKFSNFPVQPFLQSTFVHLLIDTCFSLRTNASALYARQSPHEEIYFQPRGNYRPTKGAPNNTDIAWRLDQYAMRKIDKTKMML